MKKNNLREFLKQGKPTLGTRVMLPRPEIVEVIGLSGYFDYVELSYEYWSNPFDFDRLHDIVRAAELHGLSSMLKVEEFMRGFIVPRAVDAGIDSILFADPRTKEQVKECIRLIRAETPDEFGGVHGAGVRRNVGYFIQPGSEAWVQAMKDIVAVIMIERVPAMQNLETILEVPGVDMVQFGPVDYSVSDGRAGQGASAKTQEIQRSMIKKALESGIVPRVEINHFSEAEPFIEMGVKDFCIGFDLLTIQNWAKEQGEKMRELLSK